MNIKMMRAVIVAFILLSASCYPMARLKSGSDAAKTGSRRVYNQSKQSMNRFLTRVTPQYVLQFKKQRMIQSMPPADFTLPMNTIDGQFEALKNVRTLDRLEGMTKYAWQRLVMSDEKVLEKVYKRMVTKTADKPFGEFLDISDMPSTIINKPLFNGKTLLQASLESDVTWNNIMTLLKAGATLDAHGPLDGDKGYLIKRLLKKGSAADLTLLLMLVNPRLVKRELVTSLPKSVQEDLAIFLTEQEKRLSAQKSFGEAVDDLKLIREIRKALVERQTIADQNVQKSENNEQKIRREDL